MNLSKKVLYAVMTVLFIAMYTVLPVRAENTKIGFIDAQKVLDESLRGQQVKDQLNEYVQSRQKIVDIEETELKNLQEEMTKQGAVLSSSAKQEKEELFQRKFMEYQKKVSELQKEIQQRRTDKLEEFNVELEKIAKILGEKEGYSMILTNLDVNIIIYAKPSLNLTDTVIQELDKGLSKEKDDKK
ncbi:MAG TPA: OmpH family outer membrane protein [Nitrospirota bacterium]|nr:OmpH family outer membrane protein [Nitrospirota bacterium]